MKRPDAFDEKAMTHTQLDIRVAELLGWVYCSAQNILHATYDMGDAEMLVSQWSPSTDLAQAMGLWAEHQPVRWGVDILQTCDGRWCVSAFNSTYQQISGNCQGADNIPHALTKAWVEAKDEKWTTI